MNDRIIVFVFIPRFISFIDFVWSKLDIYSILKLSDNFFRLFRKASDKVRYDYHE